MATPQKAVCGELWIWDALSDCAVWRRWLALSSAFPCKRKLVESSNETALHMLSVMCVPVFGTTACAHTGVCACVCVCVCVCVRARAQDSFTLESSAPCRAGLYSWHPPDCTQLSKWICLADHVDSSVCFWFQLMESVPLMTIHFLCRIPTAAKTMQCYEFWLWTFWRMTEEIQEESRQKNLILAPALPPHVPLQPHRLSLSMERWSHQSPLHVTDVHWCEVSFRRSVSVSG